MQTRPSRFWCILLMGILVIVGFAQGAAINTINSGNTVFLGEQGLDISAALGPDTRIGWWASGADIQGSSPSSTQEVGSQKTSFSVSPSVFSGYLGNWYRLDGMGKANGSAFTVADPQINLRIEDTTVGIDVTDKWVPTGDVLRFKIDSNLAWISSQRGDSAKITIKVEPPAGGVYNALINAAGTPVSIVDIPLTSSPYSTNPIWDTGNRANYPSGSYKIWAECNTNKMKDNYDQTGKTVTPKISLLNQDQNPLISAKTQTPAPSTTVTVSATTKPTPVITTVVPTSQPLTITTLPTTVPVTVPMTSEPSEPATSIPVSHSPTKSPGFGFILAGISLIIGIAVCSRR